MSKKSNRLNISKDDTKSITLFAGAVGNIFQLFDQANKAQTIEQLKQILSQTHADKEVIKQNLQLMVSKYNALKDMAENINTKFANLELTGKQLRQETDRLIMTIAERDKEIADLKKRLKGDKL